MSGIVLFHVKCKIKNWQSCFFCIFSPVYNDCLMCIHFLLDIGLLNVNLLYVFYILSIYYAGDNLTLYNLGCLLHHRSLQLSDNLSGLHGTPNVPNELRSEVKSYYLERVDKTQSSSYRHQACIAYYSLPTRVVGQT